MIIKKVTYPKSPNDPYMKGIYTSDVDAMDHYFEVMSEFNSDGTLNKANSDVLLNQGIQMIESCLKTASIV